MARAMIQDCDWGHKVNHFLSIAGPQAGIMKTPQCFTGLWCKFHNWFSDHTVFLSYMQSHLAPAGYWRDVASEAYFEEYLQKSTFLAPINNERQHEKSAQYKERFSGLNRLELVRFQNDSVIYPNESVWFGVINVGPTEVVTKMHDTVVYKQNTIGLKELEEADKIYYRLVPGKDHIQFDDHWILTEFIPFLF